jgi:drug/metabolite transporter (DMT)-like permease
MGETLAILALILFSSNIILTKLATARLNINIGFLISVWVNFLFAVVLFLLQMIFFSDGNLEWHTKGLLLFLSAGFFSTYMGRWFFFETIDKLGPSRASTFQVSNPMFTTIIAWLFMGEKLSGGIWLQWDLFYWACS